ncbi:hypothetical protein OE09_0433 [Flavobacteriaceae bacterium MAR_2010_72]|nr:hypothetical protein OE09_0433 [Flavobacteriaceae bacterium MAR_2010_72]
MQFYPIKFTPILKERIWGGEKFTLSEVEGSLPACTN